MIITLENLETGIKWWLNYVRSWGSDFVNSEYGDIYAARNQGLTAAWWGKTVDRPWTWKAIRSRWPPNTKLEIERRCGEVQLAQLAANFDLIRARSNSEPCIADIEWNDLAELFELCFEIKCRDKKIGSPVFGSKMCHFIFPKVFPVIDNLATGIFDYEFYWRGMKDEWLRFDGKAQAKELLRSAIEAPGIHELYPFETKIIELSHIGYTHASRKKFAEEREVNRFNDPGGWTIVSEPPS